MVVFFAARTPRYYAFVVLSVLAAASCVLLATRGARMTGAERRGLIDSVAALEREEPHRLGKGARECDARFAR